MKITEKLNKVISNIINLIMVLLMVSNAFAEINEVTDFNSLENTLLGADQDTLVIFDVDYVLMMPTKDYSLSRNAYRKSLWSDLKSRVTSDEEEFLRSIIVADAKWELMDQKILDILLYLEENSIPTIAMTALNTGKMGVIKSREDLRIHELKSLNISFKNTSPFNKDISLDSLKTKHGIPLLKDGIIFTAEQDKGFILDKILTELTYKPNKIIFIDDKFENIKSVESFCQKTKIPFVGFYYRKIELIKTKNVDDENFEKLLIKTLEQDKIWLLSDKKSKL